LVDDVRKAADVEYATGRFPDSEILEYLNQSIVRFYTMLDRMDSTYYQTSTSFTTTSGVGKYSLPSNFWSLKGVSVQLSADQSVRCRKYTPEEGSALDNQTTWHNYSYPIFYRIEGDFIRFRPLPAGEYTVTLDYTPLPQRLTLTPVSEFDGVAGFERWVILDAAAKCKIKDSLDPSLLMAEKAEVEAWISSTASSRDAAYPEMIQDVQSVDMGRIFREPW
jgi:hypothetical protein